ncbi:hypothetical protein [Microbacterium testaceum]|uniref:hypothetical protein n=1 Tax=Microbacterium testaceum TaxID=2033 RepID=UPI000AFAB44E|nr:hypothetical protein [Microbacterium testaceum]
MKRVVAPGVLVLLLAFSGCTGTETTGVQSEATPAASSAQEGTGVSASAEPTEATPGPIEVSATPAANRKATSVLTGIQLAMSSYGLEVDAAQIKSASDYTCEQLATGAPQDSIVALTGDVPQQANLDLVQLAADEYCPIR